MDYTLDPRMNREYFEMAARGTRMILEQGFTPSRGGDITLRDPSTGLIYVSAGPCAMPFDYPNFSECRAPDIAVFTLDGTPLTPWSIATIELPMHLAILRARPEINCVLHTHPLWASVFAIAHKNIPLVLVEQYVYLGGEVECAKYAPAGDLRVGDYAVQALGQKSAVILASHGAVTVGDTMNTAFRNMHFLENVAQKALFASVIGDLHTILPEEALAEHFMPGTK